MEIEICTTKKKLTKSIVNQMQTADRITLKNGVSLGYFVNIIKGQFRTMLILHDKKYYTISMAWTKGCKDIYLRSGKWSSRMSFDTADECTDWWLTYIRRKAEAINQIYI